MKWQGYLYMLIFLAVFSLVGKYIWASNNKDTLSLVPLLHCLILAKEKTKFGSKTYSKESINYDMTE